MKTDDLIKALSEDVKAPASLGRWVAIAAALGISGAAAIFFAGVGMRPDIGVAIERWRFILKIVIAGGATLLLTFEVLRLMRPAARPRGWPVALVFGALALGVLVELSSIPSESWLRSAVGTNWRACLSTIPILAALPLVAAIWVMRMGAPSEPMAAGAFAGGLAAAFAACLYATHCNDDSPLFVALWYPLAAALVVAAGALVGRWALKW